MKEQMRLMLRTNEPHLFCFKCNFDYKNEYCFYINYIKNLFRQIVALTSMKVGNYEH